MNSATGALFCLAVKCIQLYNNTPMQCPSDDAKVLAAMKAGAVSDMTLATYVARLETLKREFNVRTFCEVARHATKHITALRRAASKRSPLTTKNLVSAVSAMFKHDARIRHAYPNERDAWAAYHAELKSAEVQAYKRNVPLNERQTKNYVSMDEIETAFVQRASAGHAAGDRTDSMLIVLLGFYANMMPKRSDLGALRVFRSADELRTTAPSEELRQQNYVVLHGRNGSAGGVLVIHVHKTSKTYEEIIEQVPKRLSHEIAASLKAWPREYMFVGARGRPLSNNAYTKFVIASFKTVFGRAAGTSLLRHAFVTERIDFNNMSMEKRDRIAHLMGHTTDMQDTVYRWVGDWRSKFLQANNKVTNNNKANKNKKHNKNEKHNKNNKKTKVSCVCTETTD